jgi:superoxide dismutase
MSSRRLSAAWILADAIGIAPRGRGPHVTLVHDHQSNLANGAVPLYVIDAWEHAFYLQYQNRKADYCTAIWSVANWADVAARFAAARQLELLLPESVGQQARRSATASRCGQP